VFGVCRAHRPATTYSCTRLALDWEIAVGAVRAMKWLLGICVYVGCLCKDGVSERERSDVGARACACKEKSVLRVQDGVCSRAYQTQGRTPTLTFILDTLTHLLVQAGEQCVQYKGKC
jgi:hypothetical protein